MQLGRLHAIAGIEKVLPESGLDWITHATAEIGFEFTLHDNVNSFVQTWLTEPTSSLAIFHPEALEKTQAEQNLHPDERFILTLASRETPNLTNIQEKLLDLRYIIGAGHEDTAKRALSAVLKFHANRKTTDVASEMVNISNVSTLTLPLRTSSERIALQDNVANFFASELVKYKEKIATGTSNYSKYMSDILDEFLMNAIWDANPSRSNIDRTLNVVLEENEKVEIECRSDGTTFCLSVIDNHGSFFPGAFHKLVKYTLGKREEIVINEGPGGAGLGVQLIMQKAPIIIIEVIRAKQTRVSAIMRTDVSFRDMQKRPRTVLFLFKDM